MKAKSNKPRLLVCLSDLHVGSTKAILPPDFRTHEKNVIVQNELQEWLWQTWGDCWAWADKVIGKDAWACLHNGDACDGNHHGTREIWSPDPVDHAMACVQLLEPKLKGASAVFLTEGTNVHVQNIEHSIAHILAGRGIKVVSPAGKNQGAWDTLRLSIADTLIEADHHVNGSSSPLSQSATYARTMATIRTLRSRAGHRVPRVVIRSHAHSTGYFTDFHGAMLITPPWQLTTRFGHRVATGDRPTVGMHILDWRTKENDSVPVIHDHLHTFPETLPVVL